MTAASPTHAAPARLTRLAWASVGIAALVLGLKWAAYLLTGSLALYSDALESIINVAAAAAALIALSVAARPADENHPFGHTKAEYFSAVAEGVLIVLAALTILWEAAPQLTHPAPVDLPPLGLALSVAASVLNGAWASRLMRAGRQHRSPALRRMKGRSPSKERWNWRCRRPTCWTPSPPRHSTPPRWTCRRGSGRR